MDCTTLPAEIFETILMYLDLDTVKSFRLASRQLAAKCIGPHFLGRLQQPVLDVSLRNLRSLCALAGNPALSKRIHSLTFLASSLDSTELEDNVKSGKHIVRKAHGPFRRATEVTYSPEELLNAKSNLDWLIEQQKSRAQESSSEVIELFQVVLKGFVALDSICLDGAVITGRTQTKSPERGQWHPLWMRASAVFSWVVTAMVQSGISVKKFDAYRTTPRCCIPSGYITTYTLDLNPRQLDILGARLESLSLSLSGEVKKALDLDEPIEGTLSEYKKASRFTFGSSQGFLSFDDPHAVLADGTPGITSILHSALALRKLDLSFRHTLKGGRLNSYDRIIESIACEAQLPALEECSFSGFPAKGESILLFLQSHPDLRSFTLHECALTTGTWMPIFSYLDKSMPKLEDLSLSNLNGKHTQNLKYTRTNRDHEAISDDEISTNINSEQEVIGLVNLQPVWDIGRPSREISFPMSLWRFVHTRSFNREDLKKGLVFQPSQGGGRALGCPELMWWRNARRANYGLP